jgi:hypothetical protein
MLAWRQYYVYGMPALRPFLRTMSVEDAKGRFDGENTWHPCPELDVLSDLRVLREAGGPSKAEP